MRAEESFIVFQANSIGFHCGQYVGRATTAILRRFMHNVCDSVCWIVVDNERVDPSLRQCPGVEANIAVAIVTVCAACVHVDPGEEAFTIEYSRLITVTF